MTWRMCTHASADRFISSSIQRHGCFECTEIRRLLATLRRNSSTLLLDLGGNIGMHSLAAAAHGHDAIVFEPVPDNVALMLASVRANNFHGRIHVFPLCVGATGGQGCHLGTHFRNQGKLEHRIYSEPQMGADLTFPKQMSWQRSTLVTSVAVTVDDFVTPPRRPLLIKMDVENTECQAFRGMKRLLTHSQVVGLQIEAKSIIAGCCAEVIKAPTGAFSILSKQHGLCAYVNQNREPTPIDAICRLRYNGIDEINLFWQAC